MSEFTLNGGPEDGTVTSSETALIHDGRQTLTLSDFLLARIAEDEAYSADPDCTWPKRLQAESLGKRRIVALHAPVWHSRACGYCGGADYETLNCAPRDAGSWDCSAGCEGHLDGVFGAPEPKVGGCATLRWLALPSDNHPDYRDEWKP